MRCRLPGIRDPIPAVVLIPGIGMFSFGKSKTEARVTGEFYTNAIHVMEGASR
jgi:rhamnose utilization protein RhaD (predicted bifunctional aldolase and dehydrogenase)